MDKCEIPTVRSSRTLATSWICAVLCLVLVGQGVLRADPPSAAEENADDATRRPAIVPLRTVVDLDIGESADVRLTDGSTAHVTLRDVEEVRDPIRKALRLARVAVDINGEPVTLESGNYRLPVRIGGVQVDCPVTSGYYENCSQDSWGLVKRARLRLWPGDSKWIDPGFVYPVKQKWFASQTQMANEPVFVDLAEPATSRKIYYHSGLDIGGSEGQVEVIAAVDAMIVSVGEQVLDEHRRDTPILPRYDVVNLFDARGWYYRYSHLHTIDPHVVPGRALSAGERIGLLGKEGNSGGWSHLHFEIKSRQPSGRWGTEEGYAYLWQSYLEMFQPRVIAVARPHQLLRPGEEAVLDGSRSWCAASGTPECRWTFSDGTTSTDPILRRRYDQPGAYSEILEVRDGSGHVAYDFATIQVHDPEQKDQHTPLTIHAVYWPTTGIRPGDEVTFKVRSFKATEGDERWDFGDGTPVVDVRSDGNAAMHNPDGYAVTRHRYAHSGTYLVQVSRTQQGVTATARLSVTVE